MGASEDRTAAAEAADAAPERTGDEEGPPAAPVEQPHDGARDDAAEEVERDLDELVADLRRERDEYLELAQRARADFENYRRRAGRDAAEAERRGKAELARALVPAIDNLERALQASGVELEAAPGADRAPSEEVSPRDALAEGVALIHRELAGALSAAGIEHFDPMGERFDPSLHEALSTRPANDGEETGIVTETLQRGYRIEETLVRPARVVVTG